MGIPAQNNENYMKYFFKQNILSLHFMLAKTQTRFYKEQ